MAEADDVTDGKIDIIGPDLDQMQDGGAYPMGIKMKVYGRKFQSDFEPVLERRVHYFMNYGEGIWHMGQRDQNWMRISKVANEKGFKLKDLGTLFYAYFKKEYSAIVDRLEMTLITDEAEVVKGLAEARAAYTARDDRLTNLRDESVTEFYTCTLCQSFAPTHICFVSAERTGLCGAVSWLDAKATYEIDPIGVCQPVPITSEYVIDANTGRVDLHQRDRRRPHPGQDRVGLHVHHDGPPDDHLRLLRVHPGHGAGVQRDHGHPP